MPMKDPSLYGCNNGDDCMQTAPADIVPGSSQAAPHVHVRLEGQGDSAGVSIEVKAASKEAEFPTAPTHAVVPETQMQGDDEQEAELVPA